MYRDDSRVQYVEGSIYQAVHWPYAGGAADMLIILPAEGEFDAVEAQLRPEFIDEIRAGSKTTGVPLTMPRFDFETDLNLANLLPAMGLTAPFSMAEADFGGIIDGGGPFISDALHRGTIIVDEQGTEATAATIVTMAVSKIPEAEMVVDRPFIFAIVERETGTILFLGRPSCASFARATDCPTWRIGARGSIGSPPT